MSLSYVPINNIRNLYPVLVRDNYVQYMLECCKRVFQASNTIGSNEIFFFQDSNEILNKDKLFGTYIVSFFVQHMSFYK